MTPSRARAVHTVTAVVAVAALVLQTVLVVTGDSVLAEQEVPSLLTRLGRLVSYFTIQSNLLVAVTAVQLARDPLRDGRWWRPVRAAALVGITVTGLVHFALLRPLLDLHGASWVADKLLHMVVPVLAVAGWLLAGPRPRAPWRDALTGPGLAGRLAGLDPRRRRRQRLVPLPVPRRRARRAPGSVAVTCVGVTVLFLALAAVLSWLDRRMPPAPVREAAPGPGAPAATAQ